MDRSILKTFDADDYLNTPLERALVLIDMVMHKMLRDFDTVARLEWEAFLVQFTGERRLLRTRGKWGKWDDATVADVADMADVDMGDGGDGVGGGGSMDGTSSSLPLRSLSNVAPKGAAPKVALSITVGLPPRGQDVYKIDNDAAGEVTGESKDRGDERREGYDGENEDDQTDAEPHTMSSDPGQGVPPASLFVGAPLFAVQLKVDKLPNGPPGAFTLRFDPPLEGIQAALLNAPYELLAEGLRKMETVEQSVLPLLELPRRRLYRRGGYVIHYTRIHYVGYVIVDKV